LRRNSWKGSLSRRLQPIKRKLLNWLAVMEAGIDFGGKTTFQVLPGRRDFVGDWEEVQVPLETSWRARSFCLRQDRA